jgi:hypothetical protein
VRTLNSKSVDPYQRLSVLAGRPILFRAPACDLWASLVLATDPDTGAQNGAEVVALAKRAVEISSTKDAPVLETLSAAYAVTGRFGDAVTTARRAAELAAAQGQTRLAQKIRQHGTLCSFRQSYCKGSGAE